MKALITGITGFAGGHLAEHLLDSGDEVIGASRTGEWGADSPERVRHEVPLVRWDIASRRGLAAAECRQLRDFAPDCVLHLAAISVPERCGDRSPTAKAVAVNVVGAAQVVQWILSLKRPPRLLFVSSSHVYAPVLPGTARVTEEAPTGPRRGYGLTKLAAEDVVHKACDRGLEAVIVRAFQHTGPRQRPPMMLAEWVAQFVRGGDNPVRVRHLDASVDVTDVRDVVRAYRLLALRGRAGTTYNMGSGIARRTGDLVEALRQMTDTRRPIIELLPGAKQDPIADISRLTSEIDWRPEIPVEQTLADTLACQSAGELR